jgi:hypothetical protein
MNRYIVLGIAGVAAVVTVVWLTTRGAPGPATPEPTPVTTATNGSLAARPTSRPAVSTESSVATQPVLTSSPQTTGETLPIDVAPGFENLKKPLAEMKETDPERHEVVRHKELESEPRDEAWAPRIESALTGAIQDSLTAQGLETQRIELHVVECRRSGCEIQAVGYAEDNGKPGVDLQFIIFQIMQSSLGNEFDRDALAMSLRTRPDGRIGFLVFLTRKA